MHIILKPIFELITGDMVLFGDVIYNYITMGIIGLIAFYVAFRSTGSLYDIGLISSSWMGSLVHWTIRTFVFLIIFWIMSFLMWVCIFLNSISIWVWLILFVILVIGTTIVYLYSQNRNTENEKLNER